MRTRAVFFDLDGTLLRDDHGEAVVAAVVSGLAAEIPGLDARALIAADHRIWNEEWAARGDDWLVGRVPVDAVPREVWRRALLEVGVDDPGVVDRAMQLHTDAELAAHTLYDESRAVIDALRARGILLGIITNGPSELQRAKLRGVGIEHLFDAVLVSGELGVAKPDEAIFQEGLARLAVEAAAAVHVGDNLEADVAGARGAGLHAVWIDRRGEDRYVVGMSIADTVIGELGELLDLVE